MSSSKGIKPFVKWIGGKRQLWSDLKPLMPEKSPRIVSHPPSRERFFFLFVLQERI